MPTSMRLNRRCRRRIPNRARLFVTEVWTSGPSLALKSIASVASLEASMRGRAGPMNKQELIGLVADRAGLSRNDAMRAIETMLEVVTSALKRGDEVRLVGFGNFSVTRRKASTG